MVNGSTNVKCPICETGYLTCVATAPYARGFILAYQYGSKKIAGCRNCVAVGLRMEALKSLGYGWFSVTALVLNAAFIPWNLFQSLFLKENPSEVTKFFDEIGVPQPGKEYRLTEALYTAGAAIIHADNKVDPSEVAIAKKLGIRILPEFDSQDFDDVVASSVGVPVIASLGTVFRVYLSAAGKRMVLQYLIEIAVADRDFDKREDHLIQRFATNMGFEESDYHTVRDLILKEDGLTTH